MIHVGAEPPWRGYSRWYGEWREDAEGWDGLSRWTWLPPNKPRSFLGVLSRELDAIRRDISTDLKRALHYDLAALHKNVQVIGE